MPTTRSAAHGGPERTPPPHPHAGVAARTRSDTADRSLRSPASRAPPESRPPSVLRSSSAPVVGRPSPAIRPRAGHHAGCDPHDPTRFPLPELLPHAPDSLHPRTCLVGLRRSLVSSNVRAPGAYRSLAALATWPSPPRANCESPPEHDRLTQDTLTVDR